MTVRKASFDDIETLVKLRLDYIREEIVREERKVYSSYLVGTVFNVFTYPEYRRKGAATKVMTALLDEANKMGVASVDLLATADGKPLYEKLGFYISSFTSMKIKMGN